MTRDDVLNMPAGREMDTLIAEKVMGWRKYVYVNPSASAARVTWVEGDKNYYHAEENWSPSTDISAAWEVISQMHNRGFRYVVRGFFMGHPKHYAAFDQEDWADNNPPYSARAETLPLAICRAALLAVLEG